MENNPQLTFDHIVSLVNSLSKEEKERLKLECFSEKTAMSDPIKDFVLVSFQEFETVYKTLVN